MSIASTYKEDRDSKWINELSPLMMKHMEENSLMLD